MANPVRANADHKTYVNWSTFRVQLLENGKIIDTIYGLPNRIIADIISEKWAKSRTTLPRKSYINEEPHAWSVEKGES